jgi:pimeloyl-ACP methyl ester carboxylesterase
MQMERREFRGHKGIRIAADLAGPEAGLPALLMHGGGQTRHSWRNGLEALAANGYRVVAVDSRGHGESAWDSDGDYSLDAQVADLEALVAQLPPKPALVGASMGGVTALEHRAFNETRIRRP